AIAFLLNGASFVAGVAPPVGIPTEGQPHPAGRLGIRPGLMGAAQYALSTAGGGVSRSVLAVAGLLVAHLPLVVAHSSPGGSHQGDGGLAHLMSAVGAGAIAGGAGIAFLRRDRPPLSFLAGSAALLAVGVALLALVGRFGIAVALLAVLGCLQIYFSTSCNT